MPGKSYGQRTLAGYSPWGHKELDMTEGLSVHTFTHENEEGISQNQVKFQKKLLRAVAEKSRGIEEFPLESGIQNLWSVIKTAANGLGSNE